MSDEIQIDDDDAVLAQGGPLEIAGAVVTQAETAAPVAGEADLDALFGEDEDDEDLGEDDLDLGDAPEPGAAVAAARQSSERVDQLEAAVKKLAEQQRSHQAQRVRRKVTAATGGAGLVGLVPILLQVVGALNVTAEVASTVAAVAAAAGALIAGYVTPERAAPPSAAELLSTD